MNKSNWILTIGSKRQSNEFLEVARKYDLLVIHISEEKCEWVNRTYDEIFEDMETLIKKEKLAPLAIVNLGRSTVPNGIEIIAESSENIKQKYKEHLKQTKIIGPTYLAAKIFNNKWLTYKALSNMNLPLPKTQKLDLRLALDESKKNIPFPLVLKVTNLSGGHGMEYIQNKKELSHHCNEYTDMDYDVILSEYVQGDEFSVVVTSLGDDVLVHPIGIKAPTTPLLTHVDNKIKINGYLKNIETLKNDIQSIVLKYRIQGNFTLEGVILEHDPFKYVILETATRVTGSFYISNASINFNAFEAVCKYVLQKNWKPLNEDKNIVLSIPIYEHNGNETLMSLEKKPWVIKMRMDNLGEMPLSKDKRTRITVGLKFDNLIENLKTLQVETGDFGIIGRVTHEFGRINATLSPLIEEIKNIDNLKQKG